MALPLQFMESYIFIGKTLFFPKQGILVIGDLHIGYEYQIQQSGILIPEQQVQDIIKELSNIFKEIKKRKLKIKKIVFIGDIKHSFGFEWKEKNYFNEVLEFLKKYINERNIILIKGNHDTVDYSGRMRNYYIEKGIAFIHGHNEPTGVRDLSNRKIKTIVMGHLHPSIILSDVYRIKREKYKCFLVGRFKGKEIIVLPSFLTTIEGTTINNFGEEYEDFFSIIPKKALRNFEVYVVGKDKVYDFGKVGNLEVD